MRAEQFVELFIVRHGEAAIDRNLYPDHHTMPLSASGRRQAYALARKLKNADFSAIHTSPFERAVETARILAKRTELRTTVDARLRERVFAELGGMPYSTIARRYGRSFAKSLQDGNSDDLALPGCETLDACVARVQEAVDEIVAGARGDRVCVVTHGGPHDWYLQRALGLLGSRPYRRLFSIDTCNVSIILLDRSKRMPVQVQSINSPP